MQGQVKEDQESEAAKLIVEVSSKLAMGDWNDKLLEELENKLVQSLKEDAN